MDINYMIMEEWIDMKGINDIIVIGAGTAGLTCAIYGLRAGKRVLVFEEKMYGGQIVNTPSVENYPGYKNISGFEFANNLYEQAKALGMEYRNERVIEIKCDETKGDDIKTVITENGEYDARAVVIATGAKNRMLGLEREEELTGKGVSYCATCDGAFFKGRDVAVVGGGNTALEDALFLSNYCSKVYVIHRRDQFRGDKSDVDKLKNKKNVELVLNSTVEELLGESKLEGIRIRNVEDDKLTELKVAGVFIAVGQVPDNERFRSIVEMDEKGYIVAGEDCRTGADGIFAAGDCRAKRVRQLVTAAGDGAVAGLGAAEVCNGVQLK